MPRTRLVTIVLLVALAMSSCSRSPIDVATVADLDVIDTPGMVSMLADSERPTVVNVWASWCVPCRSEAPLLESAFEAFGDRIDFVGVNVRDTQNGARSFIAEFGTTTNGKSITHFFDRPGDVPIGLGGNNGVPLTFFFDAGGSLVHFHPGVIDERTLALQLDELLQGTD